ncbi:T9SS type A sorting domain-containing protein [Aquimarina sp. ERC-38]|uniref:T9SS type A sorting domain-containing protein n=1 Tax=Aquimarina sp. ERC-38 TaxID=2949996 RepID=UPI00224785F6|nr:T9SS type A sorting domain-containing protein [Aquimarina sp. ERC-38]UZO81589.1 T9SS type A sorting domain-containing protein [Aquimarina sp. ERC-38]
MKKLYLTLVCTVITCFLFSNSGNAQDTSNAPLQNGHTIEGLKVYPNPTTGDILQITSRSHNTLVVSVYNVLGNKVLFKVLVGKELNISSLKPGVYILKIKEGENHSTQKLIVSSN